MATVADLARPQPAAAWCQNIIFLIVNRARPLAPGWFMKKNIILLLIVSTFGLAIAAVIVIWPSTSPPEQNKINNYLRPDNNYLRPDQENKITLPAPVTDSSYSLEKALAERRSERNYSNSAVKLEDFSQLLWAAQGVTSPAGYRTAPSAGALYPLEIYAVVARVEGLAAGVYHYLPREHKLEFLTSGDKLTALQTAALDQSAVGQSAVCLVISGVFERTAQKYGARAERYVYLEAGHAAQNVYLQATALGLGMVTIGAFDEQALPEILEVEINQPIYLLPVGRK